MEKKWFHFGDVLSITTDYMLSPDLMSGGHNILNFMTGQAMSDFECIMTKDLCKKALLSQHPNLKILICQNLHLRLVYNG